MNQKPLKETDSLEADTQIMDGVPLARKEGGIKARLSGIKSKLFKKKAGKKKSKKKLIIVLVIIVIIAAAVFFRLRGNQTDAMAAVTYTTAPVTRSDISQTLTGTGTLQAANSYDVTSLLEGKVLASNFEEGDIVEKDRVLYQLDSSDATSDLEKADLSINQSERNYQNALKSRNDLTVKANRSGTVVKMKVEVGDSVTAGQEIAVIQDGSTMSLAVSFPADDAAHFYTGQSAKVTLDGSFETLNATIRKVAGNNTVLAGNRIVREVTLDVKNPGGISTTQSATATVNGIGSTSSGTFTYRAESTVTAKAAGDVSRICVKEGSWVKNGSALVVLSSNETENQIQTAADSIREAQLSYQKQQDNLDSYIIKSPISGTVVTKNYEKGETTEANKVLCTIYDLSYLTMNLNVDELDISKVQVGQKVTITTDAVPGKEYQGVVTKVSVASSSSSTSSGTSSSSSGSAPSSDGVTSYPVTIQINETEGLLPGMNVDASIMLSKVPNVLTVPVEALSRGNMVLVTADSPSAANALTEEQAPEGYVYVSVTTGASNDTSIEIASGLTESDVVAYIPSVAPPDMDGYMMGPGGEPSGGGGEPSGEGGGGEMGG